MLNTYIKNRGITQTIILDNNHNQINQMNWDAHYDGDIANISIDTETNGKSKHFDIKLDNNDLANLLNVQSVNTPIDKRLQMDFNDSQYHNEPYFIELPKYPLKPREPIIEEPNTSIEELITRRISSPKSNDIFLPVYNKKKHNKHRKSHVTHKVIKKSKTKSSKSKTKTNSKSKTKSKAKTYRYTTTPIYL
jgi:hypothetical protein